MCCVCVCLFMRTLCFFFFCFFFFSSRRRHTRSLCDWSSDVCSSDLQADLSRERGIRLQLLRGGRGRSPTVATACRVVRRGGVAGVAPIGGGDVREPEPSGADGGAHRSGGTRRRRDGPPPSRSADP